MHFCGDSMGFLVYTNILFLDMFGSSMGACLLLQDKGTLLDPKLHIQLVLHTSVFQKSLLYMN